MSSMLCVAGSAVVAIALFGTSASVVSAGERTFEFENKTGQDANDLHVWLRNGSTPQRVGGKYGEFDNWTGTRGASKHDFDGGTVLKDGKMKIRFSSSSKRIRLEKYRWTKDGVFIGDTVVAKATGLRWEPGSPASGNGQILVSIDGHADIFQMQPGMDAFMVAEEFQMFIESFIRFQDNFDLIEEERIDQNELWLSSNVLGNPQSEMQVEILQQDFNLPTQMIPGDQYVWPALEVQGLCPGPIQLLAGPYLPGQDVAFAYGLQSGDTLVPPCPGLFLDLHAPQLLAIVPTDAFGMAILDGDAPPVACGLVHVQAVNLAECDPTNVIVLGVDEGR